MSIDIHFNVEEKIPLQEAALVLADRIGMKSVEVTEGLIQGIFSGGTVSLIYPTALGKQLHHELYGITPQTGISFHVDKFAPYSESYGNSLNGVIALVKAMHKDAIAAVEDRPFLRRINGEITLYNEGGLFDENVRLQWRPRFDFEHAFKEKFER